MQILCAIACQYGFTENNLVIFEDNDISGMTRIDEQEGVRALVNAIERDEIKAVFLLSEYSLLRNAALIDVSYFIELCRRHHVHVVTLTQVYDFGDPMHVHLFHFVLEAESYSMYTRTTIARRFKALRKAEAALEEKE